MKNTFCFLLLQFMGVIILYAQPLSTEIYLVDISEKKGALTFSKPVNITNHEGYDNQPEFSPDGKKLLYVSMPDTNQSEIYEYIIADSSTNRLTKTDESEYSPRYAKSGITVVRVNKDKTQRLCLLSNLPEDTEELLPGMDSVGYYTPINDSTMAIVSLNKGLELVVYDMYGGQYVIAEKNIGRCILKFPGEASFLFCRKAESKVQLYKFDTIENLTSEYKSGLADVEDYAFTPDGKLLGGKDGKLYQQDLQSSEWKMIADFTETCGSFYRMTVSPDGKRIALVTYKGKKP